MNQSIRRIDYVVIRFSTLAFAAALEDYGHSPLFIR